MTSQVMKVSMLYTPPPRDPKAPPVRINLLSDTQTRPTPGMREAMARAEVGDEQIGDDPTVNLLCERVADLLGKEVFHIFSQGNCHVLNLPVTAWIDKLCLDGLEFGKRPGLIYRCRFRVRPLPLISPNLINETKEDCCVGGACCVCGGSCTRGAVAAR